MNEKIVTLLLELDAINRRAREIVDELSEITTEQEKEHEDVQAVDDDCGGFIYPKRVRR